MLPHCVGNATWTPLPELPRSDERFSSVSLADFRYTDTATFYLPDLTSFRGGTAGEVVLFLGVFWRNGGCGLCPPSALGSNYFVTRCPGIM